VYRSEVAWERRGMMAAGKAAAVRQEPGLAEQGRPVEECLGVVEEQREKDSAEPQAGLPVPEKVDFGEEGYRA